MTICQLLLGNARIGATNEANVIDLIKKKCNIEQLLDNFKVSTLSIRNARSVWSECSQFIPEQTLQRWAENSCWLTFQLK